MKKSLEIPGRESYIQVKPEREFLLLKRRKIDWTQEEINHVYHRYMYLLFKKAKKIQPIYSEHNFAL